jgi:hypothetical protein
MYFARQHFGWHEREKKGEVSQLDAASACIYQRNTHVNSTAFAAWWHGHAFVRCDDPIHNEIARGDRRREKYRKVGGHEEIKNIEGLMRLINIYYCMAWLHIA